MGNSHDFYDQILSSAPSQETRLLVLTKLKEEGEIERVIQECLKVLSVYPNDIHLRRLLAESYLETSQVSNAEAELKKIIELLSNLADVHKLQAEIYGGQGRNEEALEALNVYLAYHPQDDDARRMHDDLKPDEAPPVIEPESPPEEAAVTFGEHVEAESPEIVTSTLAELYFEQGKLQKAIDTYRTLVSLNPEDTPLRERLETLEAIQNGTSGDQETQDTRAVGTQRMIAILESWRSNIREHVNPN